ncbi:MAG: hypothetical protein GX578_06085 [Clostridiales bacterium]|nr:hypothetical protein [Clostridiales bacterium]
MLIIDKYKDKINGVLSTFDRMILKGHLRQFFSPSGKMHFLSQENVLLKDFGDYAKNVTSQIKEYIENMAQERQRSLIYLTSPKVSKEETALDVLKRDPVEEGLICIISTVELCKSVEVRKSKDTEKLELQNGWRKCLYYYFYYLDREFGFMHVRLQSWFPFEIQVYINGREYLSKQLDKQGINYQRYDNSFTSIADIPQAQEIANAFTGRDLNNMLNHFANEVNPFLKRLEEIFHCGYFWCLDQCEYATDVMFKSRDELQNIYPDIVKYALLSFKCEDVMTFLGRKMHPAFSGEVVSDMKKRPQGIRIKHRMKNNSIKMYDKDSVLRVEMTINTPREFKIFKESGAQKQKKWVPMGKSIANLYRYAQVSEAANKRYLDALSLVEPKTESIQEIEKICHRVTSGKRTFSGMNPISKEAEAIFLAVMDAGNHINGFTNASIRKFLFLDATMEDKKIMNKTTRIIAKLRAHKLIAKIPHSFRYKVTVKGIRIMSAALAVKNIKLAEIMKKVS